MVYPFPKINCSAQATGIALGLFKDFPESITCSPGLAPINHFIHFLYMLPHMPRQGLCSESFMWLGGSLHAAQTFTTSSLICLGSLLIRSISLVWLSFTIFSSLVLYWYWSAMVGLQVLDGQETVRVNLPGSNASVHCWTPVSPLWRSLWHASGQLLQTSW